MLKFAMRSSYSFACSKGFSYVGMGRPKTLANGEEVWMNRYFKNELEVGSVLEVWSEGGQWEYQYDRR